MTEKYKPETLPEWYRGILVLLKNAAKEKIDAVEEYGDSAAGLQQLRDFYYIVDSLWHQADLVSDPETINTLKQRAKELGLIIK